jgi:hypothetical protein
VRFSAMDFDLSHFQKQITKMASYLADKHLNVVFNTNNNAIVGAHSGGRENVEQNQLWYRTV